jgi:hypothetical protein
MLSALPQNIEYSSIMMFLLCHAPKLKSLWMLKSTNIAVRSAVSRGGALVLLPVMGDARLVMQAIIVTPGF